jgi:peptidoglycan/LPS O-acetylase OafA/YrhL
MSQFISGAITMAYLIAGLFFLRFWKATRDRLFAFFALAFWVLAGQRFALALSTQTVEDSIFLYVVRLIAFILILTAIVEKNRSRTPKD